MKFYFIYKSLAHPELAGDYVQPFTLDERLAHARQAEKQLGATVPWLVDAMDNRLKHALGDRPNSEFIIDPAGKVVRKRAWSHPGQVRKDLDQLVGKVDRITKDDEVALKLQPPIKSPATRGVVERLSRPRMQPLEMEPQLKERGHLFYAKLRAEGNRELLTSGKGSLYLGFHLDPVHGAHWNNLTEQLRYKLELPDGVQVEKAADQATKVQFASDCDPREFLVQVAAWPADKPVKLTVWYSACVGEEACHAVKQEYILHRRRDKDGGGARGVGAGLWDPKGFANQLLERDKNGDGKLAADEVMGLVLPHFRHFDRNNDGFLTKDELTEVANWLNHHHQPGAPPRPKP